METLLALCIGVTLSAACGFRVFIPPLVMSVGSIYGDLPLTPGFEWVGTYPAMIAFGGATAVEIVAYYIPVVDNFLDTIEIPTALAVGTMLTAATLGSEIDPVLKWTIAAIAGGGAAGIVEGFTSVTRLASTSLTGGLGNPLVSTTEALSATVLSILALLVPVLAFIVVVVVLVFGMRKVLKFLKKRRGRSPSKSFTDSNN
ncbi:MAG: DUF4126 domain-containing protein [Xenococcaceae cyanobacterium]